MIYRVYCDGKFVGSAPNYDGAIDITDKYYKICKKSLNIETVSKDQKLVL